MSERRGNEPGRVRASEATEMPEASPQPAAAAAVDDQEIERVLRRKRRQAESRSCVPCQRRKVGCDKAQPCATCSKRGHPQICVYEIPRGSGAASRRSAGARTGSSRQVHTPRRASSLQSPGRDVNPAPVVEQSRGPSVLTTPGQANTQRISPVGYSIASIVQSKAQQAGGEALAQDVGPVLGLRNTLVSYPFMNLTSPGERWCGLLEVIPHRHEVLTFLPVFQMRVFPLTPILVDMEGFEMDAHSYLRDYTAGEFKNAEVISAKWGVERHIGLISLILAVLSSGAHFSDLDGRERSRICYDLARRSFQALRLANFLFRPTLESIQAMLILGNTLQNTGQSDAAWSWLGTTARLAQTLNFHAEATKIMAPEPLRSKAKECWSNILWQDALLSLCHDRLPIISRHPSFRNLDTVPEQSLTYVETMHAMCQLSLGVLCEEHRNLESVSSSLSRLDALRCRTLPYLQSSEHCKSSREHLQYLALKMHMCFFITYICRPAIKNTSITQSSEWSPEQDMLQARAEENLIESTRTFLDFQAVSSAPLRSWSVVHNVLSSVLLLSIWEVTRTKPECQLLRQKIIEAFCTPETMVASETADPLPSSDNTQWLSERHIRALIALQNAFTDDDSGLQLDPTTTYRWKPPSSTMPQPDSGFASFDDGSYLPTSYPVDLGYNIFNGENSSDPSNFWGLSPVNYLDSIMSGAAFQQFSNGPC
ncbi:hypothetical protein BX600DRAFT_157054 [Xylariales sp. PMI_506]|nr:hypothetical protein BX600DRAFT_157054 [Xylariales sp. PMI_506]